MPEEDDAFERAARREAEIAEALAEGRLTADQAAALRDLVRSDEAIEDNPVRAAARTALSMSQLRTVLDNDLDPELVATALNMAPRLSTDEILELLVDFAPGHETLDALADPGLADLEYRSVACLLEHEVYPADLLRLREAGVDLSAQKAVEIAEQGGDAQELAAQLRAHPQLGVTADDLVRICAQGVELGRVAELVELGLGLDRAIDLAVGDLDPDVIRRLIDHGVEVDLEEVAASVPRSPWSGAILGVKSSRRHIGLIIGDHFVGRDVTVSGAVFGSVTVAPGVRAILESWISGDVIVQRHASVEIRGQVRGRVRNRGGQVEVSGSVRGGVQEESTEPV
ncbi:MAG TPA: hypothetical protein VE990_10020 [Acidimicrobiales bacterium]|nr:hypothetical protein [Acidimicrobiales bacterium]